MSPVKTKKKRQYKLLGVKQQYSYMIVWRTRVEILCADGSVSGAGDERMMRLAPTRWQKWTEED